MKKLQTETGAYTNGEIYSRVVCLPDDADTSAWGLVSEEEYQQHIKEEEERMQREMMYPNAD